jgi:ferric-dicitrate binding protein FerR (iron transport regulator)
MKSNSSDLRSRRVRPFSLGVIAAGILTLSSWALAQEASPVAPPGAPAGQQAGPAARAVRLSSVDGQVQITQGNQVLASPALANTPLFEGTQISTSDDGRAEIQMEDGSVARISPNSSLTLGTLSLQGNTADTELVLNSGLAYFEMQGDTQAKPMRVRFGDDVATSTGYTVLRINLDYPPGEVAVFSGNVHVEGGTSLALDLHGGESVKLNGPDSGNYVVAETIEPDSWDTWNSDRDQALTAQEADRTEATNSVPNSSNPAWSDLDANGNWYNVPGQGYVWSPYEAGAGNWDPYGCGSWTWTPRFGYIWVSCEQWGYMPYASGTWGFYDGLGWGWAPGLGGPWWGGAGWGFNFGPTPVRYRPPHRPVGGPRPGGGSPIRAGGRYQPYPVVAVNRVQNGLGGVPVHVRNAPVTVGGNTVQPLRPVSARPVYGGQFAGGQSAGGVNHGSVGNGGANPGARYGYAPGSSGRASMPPPSSAYRPTTHYGSYSAPHYSAPSRPSYSAPPASHPSGGGGAPHGGGGGGGGAHK